LLEKKFSVQPSALLQAESLPLSRMRLRGAPVDVKLNVVSRDKRVILET
jgi:hypothetical protein